MYSYEQACRGKKAKTARKSNRLGQDRAQIVTAPKKNSPEWKAQQAERYLRKKEINEKKKGDFLGDELTPVFVSSMIFGAAIP